MPIHSIGYSFKDDSGSVPLSATEYIVPNEENALYPIPAGSVDLECDIEFLHLKVQDYVLAVGIQTAAQKLTGKYSEPAIGALTIKTNSTSVPVPAAFTLQAKQPQAYAPCLVGTTNIFTADVTKFFVSNAGAGDLVLIVKVGLTN